MASPTLMLSATSEQQTDEKDTGLTKTLPSTACWHGSACRGERLVSEYLIPSPASLRHLNSRPVFHHDEWIFSCTRIKFDYSIHYDHGAPARNVQARSGFFQLPTSGCKLSRAAFTLYYILSVAFSRVWQSRRTWDNRHMTRREHRIMMT